MNNKITLKEAMDYIDNYLTEAENSNKKQEIINNQDILKENFSKISKDLKDMVLKYSGRYELDIKDEKSFNKHEDHKEEHYKLIYSLKNSKNVSDSEISKILGYIGSKVEKEFKSSKKEYLDKGLYFDNKPNDAMSRFVELHYDFY